MKLFVDSSAIIEFFENNQSAVKAIDEADEIYTSAICAHEVLFGEYYKREKGGHALADRMESFLKTVATLPFTYENSMLASKMKVKLYTSGKKIDEFDVLIAAQALSMGAVLLTKDSRHFDVLSDEFSLRVQKVD